MLYRGIGSEWKWIGANPSAFWGRGFRPLLEPFDRAIIISQLSAPFIFFSSIAIQRIGPSWCPSRRVPTPSLKKKMPYHYVIM